MDDTYEVFIAYIMLLHKLQETSGVRMLGMHRDHGENRLDPFLLAEMFNSCMKH